MLSKFIAGRIGLPLFDQVKGLQVRKYYSLYKKTLKWERKEIENYQINKLRNLIEYAFENVPFYTTRLKKYNLTPDSINSFMDIKKIPPLSRRDFQESLDLLISKKVNRKNLFKSSSSGTTGIPIVYYKDNFGESADIAAGYLQWFISGWELGAKRIHIWGNPESIQNWDNLLSKLKRKLLFYKNYPSFLLNNTDNFPMLVELINSYQPDYLDGYTSSLYLLAKYIMDNNIKIHNPRKVFTTAENLYGYQQNIIEEHLAPVIDCYGFGEINGVAVQCEKKNYHIIEPRVLVEEENYANGKKQILVTDLENLAMPMIRYRVGDLFEGLSQEKCSCGLNYLYFRHIEGRTSELIKLADGRILSPVTLFGGTAFRRVKNVIRHQTIWNGKNLVFLFEVNNDFLEDEKNELKRILEEALKDYAVEFELKIAQGAIETSNKFTYFRIEHDSHS